MWLLSIAGASVLTATAWLLSVFRRLPLFSAVLYMVGLFLILFVGIAYLLRKVFRVSEMAPKEETAQTIAQAVVEVLGDRLQGATATTEVTLRITGDTRFQDVWSWNEFSGYLEVTDYRFEFDRFDQRHKLVQELTLGQIALLRRLGVSKDGPTSRTRCEAVLRAAGASDPSAAVDGLAGLNLIDEDDRDRWSLTGSGEVVRHVFSSLLTHDPRLVSAYRRVTINIDKRLRFDGGKLVPQSEQLPPEWP